MGKLIYNSSARELEIDDRTLAHLRVAILNKLRRSESFAMTWEHGLENGSGRTTIWLHESIPLQFVFSGNRQPKLNRLWVEQFLLTANSTAGLHWVPEPEQQEEFEGD
ncbi:ATP-dependent DNA ligase [Agromyces intestinalis]|uniref:ATP-dependent DNA ligase n=1 Tax=Agromyces intestinalis TaxID=2592652 RepID=A0A5C1YES2_9MICO|nr:ATP-dependent DNA ligase [Agromyces intestinalis]QEO14188.1 ATP-dependent DNA ligase [Agromyces intestinalis]